MQTRRIALGVAVVAVIGSTALAGYTLGSGAAPDAAQATAVREKSAARAYAAAHADGFHTGYERGLGTGTRVGAREGVRGGTSAGRRRGRSTALSRVARKQRRAVKICQLIWSFLPRWSLSSRA